MAGPCSLSPRIPALPRFIKCRASNLQISVAIFCFARITIAATDLSGERGFSAAKGARTVLRPDLARAC